MSRVKTFSTPKVLCEVSYYRTGGSFDRIFVPENVKELISALKKINQDASPYFVLGEGANSLIMDTHWPGSVILTRNMNQIEIQEQNIIADAGVNNTLLASIALQNSFSGAEWLYRLPGQLGGTIRMNARCYGGEMSQIASEVIAVTPEGERKVYKGSEVFRGYKNTIFQDNGEIIAAVRLKLEKSSPREIQQKMEFCEKDRQQSLQFSYPSCGCVFKNDYSIGIPSGYLLEKSGVKGMSNNGAFVGEYHANFIFNKGAKSRDILELALEMRETVFSKFGVWLDFEMEILGVVPNDLGPKLKKRNSHIISEESLKILRQEWKTERRKL